MKVLLALLFSGSLKLLTVSDFSV